MADAISELIPERKGDSFDLPSAAEDFYDRFPAYAGYVSFVDVSSGAIINSDPAKVQELIEIFSSERGMKVLGPVVTHCQQTKTPYSLISGNGDCVIFMYTQDDRPSFFGDAVSPARELQFIFDHETGHVVVPEGSSDDRLKAENAADAFALLCDLKRHGDADLAQAALLFRTSYALFNEKGMVNFSAPMIEKFIAAHNTLAQDDLTPQRMVSLAAEFANHDTMPQDRAKEFVQSLEKLRRLPSLDTLAHITLETPLPDTFKWTSTILKTILEGHGSIPGTTAEAFRQACRDVPVKLQEREKQFLAQAPRKLDVAAMPS